MLSSEFSDDKDRDVHTLILSRMIWDDLHLVIRNDKTLILFGAVELQRKEPDCYHDIRYSLHCLARLLLEYRKNTGNENARAVDLVICRNFEDVVNAAKALTGYNGPRKIKSLHTFCNLWFCLRNLVFMVRAVALKEDNRGKLRQC